MEFMFTSRWDDCQEVGRRETPVFHGVAGMLTENGLYPKLLLALARGTKPMARVKQQETRDSARREPLWRSVGPRMLPDLNLLAEIPLAGCVVGAV
jgi:hypothetical protein